MDQKIGENWQLMSEEEKEKWNAKSEILWQEKGRKLNATRVSGFNLFTRDYLMREGILKNYRKCSQGGTNATMFHLNATICCIERA